MAKAKAAEDAIAAVAVAEEASKKAAAADQKAHEESKKAVEVHAHAHHHFTPPTKVQHKEETTSTPTISVTSPSNSGSISYAVSSLSSPSSLASPTSSLRFAEMVEATFDFTSTRDDQLSFHKGDVMRVVSKGEGGKWWQVILVKTNKAGYVPSNYVKPHQVISSPISSLAPAAREAEAIFEYKATESGQISFAKGERLMILSQGLNWWQATNKAGDTGAIPKAFVKLLPKAADATSPVSPNISVTPPATSPAAATASPSSDHNSNGGSHNRNISVAFSHPAATGLKLVIDQPHHPPVATGHHGGIPLHNKAPLSEKAGVSSHNDVHHSHEHDHHAADLVFESIYKYAAPAAKPEQLSYAKGDLFNVKHGYDDTKQWIEATHQKTGTRGMVAKTFIRAYTGQRSLPATPNHTPPSSQPSTPDASTKPSSSGFTLALPQPRHARAGSVAGPAPPAADVASTPSSSSSSSNATAEEVKMETIYSYKAKDQQQLSYARGTLLVVQRIPERKWWMAHNPLTGEDGMVAATYVKPITTNGHATVTAATPTSATTHTSTSSTDAKWYEAIYAFTGDASHADQLSMKQGDHLQFVSMKDANWTNVTNKDGKTGFVPTSYIKEVAHHAPKATTVAQTPTAVSATGAVAGTRLVALFPWVAKNPNQLAFANV
jgi:hypothetical protein